METLSYKKEDIEKLLNIINTLPFQGFQAAGKITQIYSILNNPLKDKPEQKQEKQEKPDVK